MSEQSFNYYLLEAKKLLDENQKIYIIQGLACWKRSFVVKVICLNPYHAVFMKNMLIDPKEINQDDLKNNEGEVDLTIYSLGKYNLPIPHEDILQEEDKQNPLSDTLVGLNLSTSTMLIYGTEYAGEMKKGVFTYMLYKLPLMGELPLHSSATKEVDGSTTLFLGLSGTGKTTLSSDDNSLLIGDDEHVWSDDGIYNIEGGCYAKCAYLDSQKEPIIYNAIRYGSVLENVVVKDSKIDYQDVSITENTRCSYPLSYISNCCIPAIGTHPTNIIFLTCDASGVLPPLSKLDLDSAVTMFLAGYTSKVAGTEVGVTKPEPTFSSCFAGPFIVWKPERYGQMLKEKLETYKTNVWLVNTGYQKSGKRYPLSFSRSLVSFIKKGFLEGLVAKSLPYFNFEFVVEGEGLDKNLLDPELVWEMNIRLR